MAQDTPTKVIRIVVVDDHPLVREGLSALIHKQPHMTLCGEAEDAPAALRLIGEVRPDVALVDITLKDGNGLDLIKNIRTRYPDVRVLVSSMHDEDLFAERALHAGALGYVHKQQGIGKLIEAIERVLEGGIYLSEGSSQRLLARYAKAGDRSTASPLSALSDREVQVFEFLGQGLGTREIAQKLHLSPKTVERYRENIKHKLGLPNAHELIRHATRYVLEMG